MLREHSPVNSKRFKKFTHKLINRKSLDLAFEGCIAPGCGSGYTHNLDQKLFIDYYVLLIPDLRSGVRSAHMLGTRTHIIFQ